MRILSGIQPSGTLHLGNYFGMMKPAIELQEKGDAYYFIADLHALTTVQDPGTLRANAREVAVDFLACGLDPVRSVFFRQSDVPAVTELAWILSTVTPMGLLERCHSYKDKTAHGFAASHGLFAITRKAVYAFCYHQNRRHGHGSVYLPLADSRTSWHIDL